MPEMLQLHAWLAAHIPAGDADPSGTRISHGDFRWVLLAMQVAVGTICCTEAWSL